MTAGQRFARFVTTAVVKQPALWQFLRGPMRRQFDALAATWHGRRHTAGFPHLEAALEEISGSPRTILDLGTGTGAAALPLARRWPDAEITGVDLSPAMIEVARREVPPELADRIRFEVADAAQLPHRDGSFDLVVLANMIPFFDEIARIVAPGGYVVFGFSAGAGTPIYVPPDRLRAELDRRGFIHFAEFAAGTGTAFLARNQDRK